MDAALSIDRRTGEVRVGGHAVLTPGQARAEVEQSLAALPTEPRDLGNGYAWLTVRELSFGGEEATLALCFAAGRLAEAAWSVQLPDAPMQDGWPTRAAIDAELAFVRLVLARDMALRPGPQPWGVLWSHFDAKGVMAAHGLRYRAT